MLLKKDAVTVDESPAVKPSRIEARIGPVPEGPSCTNGPDDRACLPNTD